MTARRRTVPARPRPSAPSWHPLPGGERWEDVWNGAAPPVARGIPRTQSPCLWRQRRNRRLRAQYGTEQMS